MLDISFLFCTLSIALSVFLASVVSKEKLRKVAAWGLGVKWRGALRRRAIRYEAAESQDQQLDLVQTDLFEVYMGCARCERGTNTQKQRLLGG